MSTLGKNIGSHGRRLAVAEIRGDEQRAALTGVDSSWTQKGPSVAWKNFSRGSVGLFYRALSFCDGFLDRCKAATSNPSFPNCRGVRGVFPYKWLVVQEPTRLLGTNSTPVRRVFTVAYSIHPSMVCTWLGLNDLVVG